MNLEARLDTIARRALGGPLTNLRRLTGGASQETWAFDVGVGETSKAFILRRAPDIAIADTLPVVGLDVEAKVISAVARHGVPIAPIVYSLAPDDQIGSGFIADRMPGEALGRPIVSSPQFEETRSRLAVGLGQILARIHSVPASELPSLKHFAPADSIDDLERQLRAANEPRPVFEVAIHWLREHCPPDDCMTLVHGDFRTGNYLLEPEGVSAVLDWEACHLGDPMEDLGFLCMPSWRFGRLDRPAGGVGSREQLFAGYSSVSGSVVDRERVRFWEILGMLRWGLTCVFMAESLLRGEGHSEWAAVARRASEAELEILHAIAPETRDA